MTEKSDSLRCSDAQEWERWRNAGELLGRVRKSIGFGRVSLEQDDSGVGEFVLLWSITASGKRYAATWTFNSEELSSVISIDLIAQRIVDDWRNDARNKIGRDDAQTLL